MGNARKNPHSPSAMGDDAAPFQARSALDVSDSAAGRVLASPLFVKMITAFQGGLPKDLYDLARRVSPDWATISASQRRQRVRLLGVEVIRRGDMALLQLAARVQYHEPVGRQIVARRISLPIQHAIEHHRPEMVRWIYTNGCDPCARATDMYNDAVTHFCGDFSTLETLKVLLSTSTEIIEIQPSVAYQLLDIHLLIWVHENVPGVKIPTVRIMSEAAGAGKLDIVRFLHVNYPDHVYRSDMYTRAWATGAHDVLEYLLRHRSEPYSNRFREGATDNGSVLEMIQQLRGVHVETSHNHNISSTATLHGRRPITNTKAQPLNVATP
jgi:hypothetical protein